MGKSPDLTGARERMHTGMRNMVSWGDMGDGME